MGSLIGGPAPAFRLQDQDGTWVELRDLLEAGPLVLAFYPADLSPVCTKQLCGYRDAGETIRAHGVQVVGISPDPPARHREFLSAKRLGFRLLSDPDLDVFRRYRVFSRWLPMKSRGIFVIGRDGLVRHARVEPTALTHRTAAEVLAVLEALRGQL